MMFETMHVLHISEITHEITSDCYSEYTGYQYGSQEELSYVQIGENNGELGKWRICQSRVCCGEWRHRS